MGRFGVYAKRDKILRQDFFPKGCVAIFFSCFAKDEGVIVSKRDLSQISCPECGSDKKIHTTYTVNSGEERKLYCCSDCGNYFSETNSTPIARLRTPLSVIIPVIKSVNEGRGINAATRVFGVGKKSIKRWLERLGDLKNTLLLYALCHQFLQSIVEGDELYTKVGQNKQPSESEGWTIVLMDRASRFLWELACGERDAFSTAGEACFEQVKMIEATFDGL